MLPLCLLRSFVVVLYNKAEDGGQDDERETGAGCHVSSSVDDVSVCVSIVPSNVLQRVFSFRCVRSYEIIPRLPIHVPLSVCGHSAGGGLPSGRMQAPLMQKVN